MDIRYDFDIRNPIQCEDFIKIVCSGYHFHKVTHFQKLKKTHFLKVKTTMTAQTFKVIEKQ